MLYRHWWWDKIWKCFLLLTFVFWTADFSLIPPSPDPLRILENDTLPENFFTFQWGFLWEIPRTRYIFWRGEMCSHFLLLFYKHFFEKTQGLETVFGGGKIWVVGRNLQLLLVFFLFSGEMSTCFLEQTSTLQTIFFFCKASFCKTAKKYFKFVFIGFGGKMLSRKTIYF